MDAGFLRSWVTPRSTGRDHYPADPRRVHNIFVLPSVRSCWIPHASLRGVDHVCDNSKRKFVVIEQIKTADKLKIPNKVYFGGEIITEANWTLQVFSWVKWENIW